VKELKNKAKERELTEKAILRGAEAALGHVRSGMSASPPKPDVAEHHSHVCDVP
jgi:hypothetical protein